MSRRGLRGKKKEGHLNSEERSRETKVQTQSKKTKGSLIQGGGGGRLSSCRNHGGERRKVTWGSCRGTLLRQKRVEGGQPVFRGDSSQGTIILITPLKGGQELELSLQAASGKVVRGQLALPYGALPCCSNQSLKGYRGPGADGWSLVSKQWRGQASLEGGGRKASPAGKKKCGEGLRFRVSGGKGDRGEWNHQGDDGIQL